MNILKNPPISPKLDMDIEVVDSCCFDLSEPSFESLTKDDISSCFDKLNQLEVSASDANAAWANIEGKLVE